MIHLTSVATPEDVDLIVQLAKEIWEEHYTSIIGPQQVQYMLATLQSKEAILSDLDRGKEYVLINLTNQAVGYLSYDLMDQQLFLSKLYLKKNQRGKGNGRFLITQIKDIAQKNKKRTIVLTVNKHNHASIAAYKTFGFDLVKEQQVDIGNGYIMDDYVFHYSL